MCRFVPLLFLMTFSAVAADPVSRPSVLHLRLDSAVRMALAKNFSIEAQRIEPRIARERLSGQLGQFDPRFLLSASAAENRQRAGLIAGRRAPFDILGQNRSLRTSLGGLTPWGLSYDVGLGINSVSGNSYPFGEEYSANAGLSVVQPLLRGFGTDANLAQVRIARTNILVSEWELRKRIIDTITVTDFVYNELHLAHENLRVANRSRQLALQLLADNSKRAEIGVMSPLNVTTARAEAAARQESVILAQRQVKDNENLLKQLVSNDLERMLSVSVEIEPPLSPAFRADVRGGINEALTLRPDYRQALLEIHNRSISLAYSKDQALPRLDLTGSLHLLGFDSELGGSLAHGAGRDRTEWSAGAIFSVPIPNREGRAGVAAAQLSSAQALINLQRLEQQVVVDVDNASGQILTARERIGSTGEARALAKESLDAGEERLRTGTGTTFEVLELQKRLIEAEVAGLRAGADYNKAVAEYHRQTGTTLKVYGVVVE